MRAYINVTSLDVHRRFWVSTVGATEAGDTALEIPGLRVELREGEPTGGTRGTPLDHIGFQVPNLPEMVERVRSAGYPIVTRESLPAAIEVDAQGLASIPAIDTRVAFTIGPDDLKTEFLEYAGPPVALHHLHLFGPDPSAMQAWYVDALGATPAVRGRFISGEFAGVRLSFSPASWPLEPTLGRTIERVAFDVADLEAVDAVAARLQAAGAAIQKGASSVTTADPWGTALEVRAPDSPSDRV